ncbi:DUF4404 family protein [Adhaeretor mobilis]|uniref:DUF4404 family protein n=1 Tax=Adhaeretor mobilis TaxID=1930276 RepID=A0A517N0I8_9BACT|nr:DUF4404 family protein [Adhaeretor mobilis]QDT00652.1 hypothetical protein HG15A2_39910 [Adhaeretor mobilis]
MDSRELRETLESLKRELANSEKLDTPTRESLEELSAEIHRRLDGTSDAGDSPTGEASLTDQLQDYLLEIEAEHPRLTRVVNQVAAALANLGI